MFTGLVETTGKVQNLKITSNGARISFSVNCPTFNDVKIGDSIAINGVCLTVTSISNNNFEADIMKETLNITNLKNIKKGDVINVERAMKFNSRLDGHIVSGHIDTISKVSSIKMDGFSKRIFLNCDPSLIIKKGSIAINGVSLTVTDVKENGFEVSLIPETLNNTNLQNLKINDEVNIEYDLFAKYIKKFVDKITDNKEKKEITIEFLKEHGF